MATSPSNIYQSTDSSAWPGRECQQLLSLNPGDLYRKWGLLTIARARRLALVFGFAQVMRAADALLHMVCTVPLRCLP